MTDLSVEEKNLEHRERWLRLETAISRIEGFVDRTESKIDRLTSLILGGKK